MTTQVPARQRNDVRPREPQQRAQDRPVEQRVLHRRLRRRKRTLVLVYGDFGDADIGHFISRRMTVWSGLARDVLLNPQRSKRRAMFPAHAHWGPAHCGRGTTAGPRALQASASSTRSTR